MSQNIKKVFEKQGFVRLKGVLNFKEDLEPVLNDMAFIMNRLVHRFVSKKNNLNPINAEILSIYVIGLHCPQVI